MTIGSPAPTVKFIMQPLYQRLREHYAKWGRKTIRARGPGHLLLDSVV